MKPYPKIFRAALLLLFAGLFAFSSCSKLNLFNSNSKLIEDAESLTYLSENFPPYNFGQSGDMSGVAVEVLDILFANLDISLTQRDIDLNEWSTAYERALNEEGTVLFSMVKNEERDEMFKWVGPIAPHKEVIISRSGMGIKINTDADLNQYFFGVVDGYPSRNLLLDKGVDPSNILGYDSVEELYDALLNSDIRCISYSEQANNLILGGMGEDPTDYEAVYTIQVDQLYFAFNKSASNGLIDYFQTALDEITNDKDVDGSSTIEKILDRYSVILHEESNITDDMVIALVEQTASDLESNYTGTIVKINSQEAPYRDTDEPSLYSFAYDMDLNMVAHAGNPAIVGINFEGKPDASGKLFRDEIRTGALNSEQGTGWVDYIYTKPDKSGLYQKSTYYKEIMASNGVQYIVCSGRYK